MKTRSDKQLLILLRDNIDRLKTGLCFLIRELWYNDTITEKERDKLQYYISMHRPIAPKWEHYYFWQPRNKEVRIKWLNEQINKR
jgi:hypothetical protein